MSKGKNEASKRKPQQEEEVPAARKKDNCPDIFQGNPILDRGSSFSPYLAKVTSESEVRKVIEKIESCRKVSRAWRKTYAYRYTTSEGQPIEVGIDGGEENAGKYLLKRLINYNANNVIVYIARTISRSFLHSDRYKDLNDAADSVLIPCGYKNVQQEQENHGLKKKDRKQSKKKR